MTETVSIALCTYNGEKYLKGQLQSILAQSQLPDEMVVCDDCSSDSTAQIVDEFAISAPFPVRFFINETNLGSTRNFERALQLCTGDILFLCDQDDVWKPDKIARMSSVFAEQPRAGLVFSDADVVDADLNQLGTKLWTHMTFTEQRQRMVQSGHGFDLLIGRNYITGATMAFRADFRDLVLPVPPNTGMIHDGWIALMIASMADLVFLPEPLIDYRQHPSQQVGVGQGSRPLLYPKSHYEIHLNQLNQIDLRLRANQGRLEPAFYKHQTDRIIDQRRHLTARLALPNSRPARLPVIANELLSGRYHRHSTGWKSVVRDLLG